jgi:hypothetical protein
MYTINDIHNMSEKELATVKRRAMLNFAGFIALKVGIAIAVHYTAKSLINHVNSKKSADTPQ